nr:heparinase II/III family protein [Alcaligenes faecalis]
MKTSNKFENEISRRFNFFCRQGFLLIDYYRIRKKIAAKLPIDYDAFFKFPVRSFGPLYPWGIWLLWSLEDRLLALGEYAQKRYGSQMEMGVMKELRVLSEWSTYRISKRPDLSFAHAVRILWIAYKQWTWPDEELRFRLRQALIKAVGDALQFSEKEHGGIESVGDLLSSENPHRYLHNIPVIGTFMLAVAATVVEHPAASRLNQRAGLLFSAILELRRQGCTEGVSYDGYVLDFFLDWLSSQPSSTRETFLAHPQFREVWFQAVLLAVPGDVMNTAPLGDVEPYHMPFVWSAMAKLQAMKPDILLAWALSQGDVKHLRTDALRTMALLELTQEDEPVLADCAVVNYAAVLRSGQGEDALALVMGLGCSPMGHIHCDNGSLVLGMHGQWWIDDPGYQQYMQTSERDFTIGDSAHNAPVINGVAQAIKQGKRLADNFEDKASRYKFLMVDLTACYPEAAKTRRVWRAVWLIDAVSVVVCDFVEAEAPCRLAWHWHGHPSLYWGLQQNRASLVSETEPERLLHIFSPQIVLGPGHLHRLPGSRGQQTLKTSVFAPETTAVWWVFSRAEQTPAFSVHDDCFEIDGYKVSLDGLKELSLGTVQSLPGDQDTLGVLAWRRGNKVNAICHANPTHFAGDLEYAFYLMADGKKVTVQWYSPNPEVSLEIPVDCSDSSLKVHGFVREKANPEKKMMKVAQVC